MNVIGPKARVSVLVVISRRAAPLVGRRPC